MRIVVTGATGNVGTSLVQALSREDGVSAVVGIARRLPRWRPAKTTWVAADVASDELEPVFRGADAVVHLAWLIQPSRNENVLWRANVEGSERVFRAVRTAGVPALVYASSVGAYTAGPKDRAVDESWATHGIATSAYSRQKAYVERLLDSFEAESPHVRVVRLRPGLMFKREASSSQRRLFAGPLLPGSVVRPGAIPVIPWVPGLRFQCVHSADVAEAYRLAAVTDVRGAFNIAAGPVIGENEIKALFDARTLHVPAQALRWGAAAAWRLRLIPADRGWIDMALQAPVMDTSRARTHLGWKPASDSFDALRELLTGIRTGAGMSTPPLQPDTIAMRVREVLSGVGAT